MLKLMVSMGRPATRAFHIQAFILMTLALTVPRVVEADEYLRLNALVIVYTNTFAGTVAFSDVENVRREVDEAVEFIWRSSRMRLHLAVDNLTIYRYVSEDQFLQPDPGYYMLPHWTQRGASGSVASDLADLGYQSGSYDIVVAFYAFTQGPGRHNLHGAYAYGARSSPLDPGEIGAVIWMTEPSPGTSR